MEQNKVVNWMEKWDVLDGTGFDDLVRRYREAHDMETAGKKIKKDLGPDIEALLMIAEAKSLGVDDLIAVQATGRAPSQISAQLLAAAGVDADTIAACTVPGKAYTYIQVRKINDKE